MKRILILGVNGFIGHHLSKRILATTDWEVYGMDMQTDRVTELLGQKRFRFFEGDITINREWIEYHVRKCDTVLPLVAIATPAIYVKEPLRVLELDFEANLPIVRGCVRHGKRLVFPSTSEVYGMCADREFDPEASPLVYGPISKPRWIYACAKQLMDRVIHAYGMKEGLDYTLLRPHRPGRIDQAGRRRQPEARLYLHRRRHRRADEDHREPQGNRDRKNLQYRQPEEQLFGQGSRRHDGEARPRVSRIPRKREEGEARQNDRRRILRQGLSGRAEPRPQDLPVHER